METALKTELWSIVDPYEAAARFDVFERLSHLPIDHDYWRTRLLTGHMGLADCFTGFDLFGSMIFAVEGSRFHVVGLATADPRHHGLTEMAHRFAHQMASQFGCSEIWMRTERHGLADKLESFGWRATGFEMSCAL